MGGVFLGQRRWRGDDGGRGGGRKRPADDSFGDRGGKRGKMAQNGWR